MDGMEGREIGNLSVHVGGQGKIVKAAETVSRRSVPDSGAGVAISSGNAVGCGFHSEGNPLHRCRVDLYYSKNIKYIILISPPSPSTFHTMDFHTVGSSVMPGEKACTLSIRSPLTEKPEQDWASGGLLRIGTWLDVTNRWRLLVSDILSEPIYIIMWNNKYYSLRKCE